MKKIQLTPEQEQGIRDWHMKGYSVPVISEKVGLPMSVVRRVFPRLGLRGEKTARRYYVSPEMAVQVEMKYFSGQSTKDIAIAHDVSPHIITNILRERGVPLRPAGFGVGPTHFQWTGGLNQTSSGYIQVLLRPDHPYFCMAKKKADGACYVLEHRLRMAEKLGRPLRKEETVHHIDGDRENNNIDNLQLRQGRHGKGVTLCCADCGSRNLVPTPLD